MYRGTAVGTGVYTESLIRALPEATVWNPPFDPTKRTAFPSGRQLRTELLLNRAVTDATWIHPYLPTVLDGRAVVTVLDFIDWPPRRLDRRLALDRTVKTCGAIMCLSAPVAREVQQRYGREPVVVPPFPTAEFFAPLPSDNEGGRPVRVTYWGGYHERKGIREFLTAIARWPAAHDWEVVLVGTPPVDLVPAGLSVSVTGPLSIGELVRVIDASDLTVYPSAAEGYGLPVHESLLRGKPVLARPLHVYREMIRPGSQSILPIDPTDPESIWLGVETALAMSPRSVRSALRCPTLEAAVRLARARLSEILPIIA